MAAQPHRPGHPDPRALPVHHVCPAMRQTVTGSFENIAIGKEGATMDEVIAAARMVGSLYLPIVLLRLLSRCGFDPPGQRA